MNAKYYITVADTTIINAPDGEWFEPVNTIRETLVDNIDELHKNITENYNEDLNNRIPDFDELKDIFECFDEHDIILIDYETDEPVFIHIEKV